MPGCIFEIYYENGKECDRQYKCGGCEVHKSIKLLVEIIMEEEAHNQVNATDSAALRG